MTNDVTDPVITGDSEPAPEPIISNDPPADDSRYEYVLDKYRADGRSELESLELQAKSYGELSPKFGAFTGAPEAYEFSISEELDTAGITLDDDDPMVSDFKEIAKDLNMNNEGAQRLMDLYMKSQLADQASIDEYADEQMKEVGDTRLNAVSDWASANLDAETLDGFNSMITSAESVKVIEALISKTKSAPMVGREVTAAPSGMSPDSLRALKFAKDDSGRLKTEIDPDYRKMVDRKYAETYGEHEHRVVVGG